MLRNPRHGKLIILLAVAGLLTAVTGAWGAYTEVYRFTNETGRSINELTLQFAGVDSSLTVGLVLGVQHPLVNCAINKTDREVFFRAGNTNVSLTWPDSPLCAGGMIKVQITSANIEPVFRGGQWHEGNHVPVAPLSPEDAFQGCDIAIWAAMNLKSRNLMAWISNTGTVDFAEVRCIVENDQGRNANFLFAGKPVYKGDSLPLPFHKASGTVCVLDPAQRTNDYGTIWVTADVGSSDCTIEPEKLVAKVCVVWSGEWFEIIPCDSGH